jgi:hypothetical protein
VRQESVGGDRSTVQGVMHHNGTAPLLSCFVIPFHSIIANTHTQTFDSSRRDFSNSHQLGSARLGLLAAARALSVIKRGRPTSVRMVKRNVPLICERINVRTI